MMGCAGSEAAGSGMVVTPGARIGPVGGASVGCEGAGRGVSVRACGARIGVLEFEYGSASGA